MRRTFFITLGVFLCTMALCSVNFIAVHRVVNHARHLRTRALEAMDAGDVQAAEVQMVELASYLKKNQNWLEMVCEHEDMHEMKADVIDAQAAIEFGIEDDFYQAVYRFGEGLEHIADVEKISLGNLY